MLHVLLALFLAPLFSHANVFDFKNLREIKTQGTLNAKCADFSGNWSGTCIMDSKKRDKSVNISQFECTAWIISDSPYFIYLNGEKVTTTTNLSAVGDPWINKETVSTRLNDDQVEITFIDYDPRSSKPDFTSNGQFTLKNSRLFIKWKNSMGQSEDCELERR
ncbi:MAG TPA: hypothetical protein VIG33_05970 [Pseudobdellovibrionaceae bacterium]|jgi:hypothetical protein